MESTVNQVISKRMVNKQQMRRSLAGAQLFLQVRTQVLNDDRSADFRRWYRANCNPLISMTPLLTPSYRAP